MLREYKHTKIPREFNSEGCSDTLSGINSATIKAVATLGFAEDPKTF